MRFALAVHGTRGDVEPCAAVGRELLRRGHQVRMAVPPNLIGFVESAGVPGAVAYGPDSQKQLDADFFRDFWKVQNPVTLVRKGMEYITEGWAEMSDTLVSLTDGADLILTGHHLPGGGGQRRRVPGHSVGRTALLPGQGEQQRRADSGAVHRDPLGVDGRGVAALADDEERRGCAATRTGPARGNGAVRASHRRGRRPRDPGVRPAVLPGLAEEWRGTRPFVGALTMELPTSTDDEVASWIAAGTPPIYFGFGSMPVESPAEAIAMIDAVCAQMGERALISAGVWDSDDIGDAAYGEHVRLVGAVNHAAVFPACRAVVHHGGAGTTAAGMRARRADPDPVGRGRSAGVGHPGEAAESGHFPALLEHHPGPAARRPADGVSNLASPLARARSQRS